MSVDQEKREARIRWQSLIDFVNERYEASGSTLVDNPEQLKAYQEHNLQVLNLCVERGLESGLPERELRMLEIAALLHDIAKADQPPVDKEDISNFVLVAHGEKGADLAEKVIRENSQQIQEKVGGDLEETINRVRTAIVSHMAPHPGFMTRVLEEVNDTLPPEERIEHPYPPEGDRVAEILLAADAYSLASPQGCQKIVTIQESVPYFKEKDEKLSEFCRQRGIDLSSGEAAVLSALQSAQEAHSMIRDPGDRAWVGEVLHDSKNHPYSYSGETVSYQSAKEKFEKLIDLLPENDSELIDLIEGYAGDKGKSEQCRSGPK